VIKIVIVFDVFDGVLGVVGGAVGIVW